MSFRLSRSYSVVEKVVPVVRRPGIGFGLAVLLSMFLALAAQAQTDSGSSSSTVPTLTIVSSSATATEGDEVTYTVTAGSAPSSALPVVVHVRAHGEVMDTRTVAEVFLPAGATTVTLRLEEFTDEIDESPVNVTLTLAAGTGYSVGDPAEATVSIDYPSISGTQATPTPAPAVSPPAAPSDVSVSATTINSFTISWTAETGKTYRVEREAAFLFSYRVWQTVSNDLSSGSFTESDLPCGLYYLFQVRAKVTGSAYGDGTKKLGHSQSCPSTTSAGSRNTRDHVDPPKLRVVTDNPTEDKIQIRLLLFGPTGNEEQYTPIPASLGLTDFQVDRSKRVVGSNPKEWPDSGTDLNTNYRKTRQVAEFDWTGLECGASYHFRARSGKRTVSSIQSTVVWGHWSDDASATPMIVSLSMSVHGSTRECSNLATPNVTVIPLPQRKALFQWQEVTGAGGYQVQIQKTGQDWDRTTTPLPKKMNLASDERYIEIDLNDIYEGEGLAHDTNGFEFRVMATHSDTNRNSAFSADIIVRDSPSVTVNGHSSNRNTAVVKWNAPRNAEEYFVRWRVLGDDASGNAHTSTSPVWQLDRISLPASTFAPGAATPSPTSLALTGPTTIEHTITGLTPGALHAVQVAYRIGDGWVYSGRDAYVWTSKNKPAPLTKVAGYPFYGHFTSKTYLYRICKDTFFPNDAAKQRMWVTLIENALEEWQTATNRYIMMTPDLQTGTTEYKPCTQYSSPMQVLFHSFNDRERSEIRMIDPPDSPIPVLNWSLYVYEIAADLYKHCLHKAIACVTSPGYSFYPRDATTPLPSSDISFNKDEILAYSSTRIMRDELLPNVPSGVTFGSCLNGATPRPDDNGKATRSGSQIRVTYGTYAAYATTVHEAGHALGLSDWTLSLDEDDRYVASHPVTVDSVMNYDFEAGVDEPDCAPHPLDIMAIFSLYQSP